MAYVCVAPCVFARSLLTRRCAIGGRSSGNCLLLRESSRVVCSFMFFDAREHRKHSGPLLEVLELAGEAENNSPAATALRRDTFLE